MARAKPLVGAVKYGTAFAIAGACAGLSSIFDSFGVFLVVTLSLIALGPPYWLKRYQGSVEKGDYARLVGGQLMLSSLAIFLLPTVANYLAAWGIIWGLTAVFMVNLLNRTLYLRPNARRWMLATVLCWLYAYASDKGFRRLWGPSPYDLETIFYSVHGVFGALASATVLLACGIGN